MGKPPETKGYSLEEIYQKVKSQDVFEIDLKFDPEFVRHLYVSNLIHRTLSRMVGQGPTGPVTVKCTSDGSVAVVQRGGAFDDYERQDHTFAISGAERTTDGTTSNRLVDASEDFVTEGIKEGDTVFNTTDDTKTYVVTPADGYLIVEDDIFVSGETYKIYPCKNFEFSQQMNRIDIFTYEKKVDYQLTRDAVKALGDKIPLLADSFYSLDFYTLKVRATLVEIPGSDPVRSSVFGWFREVE